VKDGHVRDGHVKDAAKDLEEDVTQDAVEGVLGAAEDGSAKVFIVARAIFHRPLRPPWRHAKDEHVKDAA